jgi:hypothetical protein
MKATDLTDREIFAAVFGAAFVEGGVSAEYAEDMASRAVASVRAMRPKLATVGEWKDFGSHQCRYYDDDDHEERDRAALARERSWIVYKPRLDEDIASGSATSIDEAKALCDAVLAVLEARR